MQRILAFFWLIFALAAQAAPIDAPVGVAAPMGAAPSPPPATTVPHVALLLPLSSAPFARAAEAVKQGFMAASNIQAGDLPVKIYPSGDKAEDIVAAYAQATQAGARIVVGPLTKNGVTALASSARVTVPTLALNLPERDTALPSQLYLLSLAGDGEARQIARAAYAEGGRSVAIVATGGALEKRIQLAFAAEWALLGGTVAGEFVFSPGNADSVRDILKKTPSDLLFLAMSGQDARLLRPYLKADVPAYATSQIYDGANYPQKYFDLDGIRFVDMPWMLQPDHMAVMVYPKPQGLGAEMERLYALGIDAWRLALMLQGGVSGAISLDGVTGQLTFDPATHQFTRLAVQAVFRDGDAAIRTP